MIATLIASLVLRTGFSPRGIKAALVALVIAVAVGAAVLAWSLWLADHDEDVIAGHEQGVELQVQTQGRAADQNMAERADADRAAQSQAREEFDNATSHLPKSGLTDRQRIDACNELRAQGTDTSLIAKCGGL
jgi:DNA-binding PucR family transcriptional regulator